MLLEAARLFATSLEVDETIAKIAELPVPDLAGMCFVDLLTEDGKHFDRVAAGRQSDAAKAVSRRYPLQQEGGVAEVIATRKVHVLKDLDEAGRARIARDDEHAAVLRKMQPQSVVTAPIIARGVPIGALTLTAKERNFEDWEIDLVEKLALFAGSAIDNARLFEAERRARVRVERLRQIVAALSRASTAAEVAQTACRIAGELMEAYSGAVWLVRGDGSLVLSGTWGTPKEFIEQFRVLQAGTPGVPALDVLRTGQAIWNETVDDYQRDAPEIFERARAAGRLASFAALPLAIHERVEGVIVFGERMGFRYTEDVREFYRAVALHCAQALERARLLDAARAARAEAEAANRLKDEFLATVSHELRTPLTAMAGWSDRLEAKLDDRDAVAHGLDVIRRNVAMQTRIIDDILDVSRIVAGNLQLEIAAIDLCQVVRHALDAARLAIEAKQLQLVVHLPPRAPITGDARRLQQAVANLLANSTKFTDPGGEIHVAIGFDRDVATVTVRDTGDGIAPEFLPLVFEPFRQGDASTTRKFAGLGLGLAIVRKIVELHGGRARAASKGLGHGATFELELPTVPQAFVAPPSLRAKPWAADIAGYRVLLVEDEPDARELLHEVLVEQGAIVEVAGSAAEAIAAFERFAPEVLVSDISMPGEDGYTLIRRVRERGGTCYAIALTAYASEQDRKRSLAAGFDAHVGKPIDLAALSAAIMQGRRR